MSATFTIGHDRQNGSSGKATLHHKRPFRETPEVGDAVARLVRSIGRRVADEDPDSLLVLQQLEDELRVAWTTAVAGLRSDGFTDRQIGQALGVTRQAVEQRWPREVLEG